MQYVRISHLSNSADLRGRGGDIATNGYVNYLFYLINILIEYNQRDDHYVSLFLQKCLQDKKPLIFPTFRRHVFNRA